MGLEKAHMPGQPGSDELELDDPGYTLEKYLGDDIDTDPAKEPGLTQTIGAVSGSALVAGLMIGSGIFSTPGLTLILMGSASATLLMWVAGALITFCGAACYIELGTMLPSSGGDQVYLNTIFKKPRELLGFLFTFVYILCIQPAGIAANAQVFGEYVLYAAYGPKEHITSQYVAEHLGWLQRAVGLVPIFLAFGIQVLSIRWSLRLQTGITWLKLATLALIAITGLVVLTGATSIPISPLWKTGFQGMPTSGQKVSSTLFRILWAYDGWRGLNLCLGELKNPRRNLVISTAGGVGIITILYCLTVMSFFTVITMEDAIESKVVLAGVWGTKAFGPAFGHVVIPIAISVSSVGAILANIFPFSRVIVEASKAGYIPCSSVWTRVHPRWNTPLASICLALALSLAYHLAPPPGDAFDLLLDITGYPNWLFVGTTIAGLVYLRYSEPKRERTFRVWLPLAFVFIAVAVFLTVFPFVPPESGKIMSDHGVPYFTPPLVAILVIALGSVTWFFRVHRARRNVAQ